MTRRQKEIYSLLLSAHHMGIDLSPEAIAKRTAAWGKHAVRSELFTMFNEGIVTGVVKIGGSHPDRYLLEGCPCPWCAK